MCVSYYDSVHFTDDKTEHQRRILVQGHMANNWQSQEFNTNLFDSTAHVLTVTSFVAQNRLKVNILSVPFWKNKSQDMMLPLFLIAPSDRGTEPSRCKDPSP